MINIQVASTAHRMIALDGTLKHITQAPIAISTWRWQSYITKYFLKEIAQLFYEPIIHLSLLHGVH